MSPGVDIALLARQDRWDAVLLPVFHQVSALAVTSTASTRECGPDGVSFPLQWAALTGVDDIEVAPAVLSIGPPGSGTAAVSLGELTFHLQDGAVVVDVPAGRRIRSLHFASLDPAATTSVPPVRNGLCHDDVLLTDQADLSAGDLHHRLAVTPIVGGAFFAPAVTVPAVPRAGERAAMFTGGSFTGSVLTLPDLAGDQLRIALVDGDAPDFPDAAALDVHRVTGWAAPTARDLEVTGPDDTVLWAFPGELPAGTPTTDVDLAIGVRAALQARLDADEPLAGAVTVRAAADSRVALSTPTIRGALLRSIPGTTTAVLAGGPTTVPLRGDALPTEAPTSAVADVHVRYDGIRLAELSDLLPTTRAVAGVVVGPDPVRRALPPESLRGEQVARVGVVGRAPGPAELSIHLVDAAPGSDDAPLAPPAVVTVEPGGDPGRVDVVWGELTVPTTIDRPVAVTVTATSGTFLWVADPDPLVRIAIVDPDPGGRPILLADEPLVTLPEATLAVDRAALPGTPFHGLPGGDAGTLVFSSPLFCTIELTDITLRYARGDGDG